MKIAIEAQRIFRTKKHGMDLVALEVIKQLQEIDSVNEYFIFVKPDKDSSCLKVSTNFHIVEIPSAPYPIWEQYYLPKAIKKINPDILHCTSNTAPLNIKIPLILTLHDILYMQKLELTKGSWYQRLGNLYRKWIVPKVVPHCNKIITVSDFEKGEIDRFFSLPSDRVTTVYNAYGQRFNQTHDIKWSNRIKEKYKLPDKYILYLGNAHPNKNIRNVLKALSIYNQRNEQSAILVMPDVSDALVRNILKEINQSRLRPHIHLTGYIPNPELVYIYRSASLFLYPSFYESFGIPILESMASGVPVITSNRAAMPEIAGNAAELVDPDNPIEIANAIEVILQDSILHSKYKSAGLSRASAFDWKITAKYILSIYTELYHKINNSNLSLISI